MRTCANTQKYKNCLAKQSKAGSYMWVTGKFMINILTKEIDFEIANWYDKKILHQTVITNRSITETEIPTTKTGL